MPSRKRGLLWLAEQQGVSVMHRRHILVFAALLVAGAAVAGCRPHWVAYVQASPNILAGQGRFGLLPVDYAGLSVGGKTEMEYLSEKDEEQRSAWGGDKSVIDSEFVNSISENAGREGFTVVKAMGPYDAPFMLRPHVEFIEPGFFALIVNKRSEVRMKVQIVTPDGRVVDEFGIQHETNGSIKTAAVRERLREDARGLGKYAAEYLKSRVFPSDD
jgi:hypothetical protein